MEHRGFAGRAGDSDDARIPSFERKISEKTEIFGGNKIEFFLKFSDKCHETIILHFDFGIDASRK
jgi:hypothetical protein